MLSIWWGVNRIIHREILPNGCTIIADFYCQQLDRVAEKLKGKTVIEFIICMITRDPMLRSRRCEKLLKLGWITIPHPPYSSDMAPTDYHLFRSLSHQLREKKFDDDNDVKMDTRQLLRSKVPGLLRTREILSLPERWRQVIDSRSAYITES